MKAQEAESTVLGVDPRHDSRWRELADAQGSVFTSPPWIRAVCDSYGFTPSARITVDGDGRPQDGFAWVEISDIRGDRLVSLPFSDRAEPFVSDLGAWPSIVDDALKASPPLTIRCLEGSAPTADPWLERVDESTWHETNADLPAEVLHQALHPSVRRSIATAERRGVEVRASTGIDAVRTFHDMHLLLRRRKYGLLAQPVEFFERVWAEFSAVDGIVTLLAYANGDPVAGTVLLAWGDTLYFKFAASRAEALQLMPNYAVYWNTIRWASDHGFRAVDWGLSDLDQPGLVDFKRKWAKTESRIVTLRTPDHSRRQSSESGPLLAGLTALFTDEAVPDTVTARAGSLLYRYFA